MMETLLDDAVDDRGKHIAEIIHGANDGIVTTFAGVTAVVLVLYALRRGRTGR